MSHWFIQTPIRDIHYTIHPSSGVHLPESPTIDIALHPLLPLLRQGVAWELTATTATTIRNPVHLSQQQICPEQQSHMALDMATTLASSKGLVATVLQPR